jgi:hypothetical protein
MSAQHAELIVQADVLWGMILIMMLW